MEDAGKSSFAPLTHLFSLFFDLTNLDKLVFIRFDMAEVVDALLRLETGRPQAVGSKFRITRVQPRLG